jgi:hypothetical protein
MLADQNPALPFIVPIFGFNYGPNIIYFPRFFNLLICL